MADLRGFTSLTEALAPDDIVSILNTYLATMAEVVQAYEGTIDEFLGDAILAHFGALRTRDDDAERAVACVVAMQLAIDDVNRINRSRGLPEVEMGIRVATGEVIVGNLGSEKHSKHTAIGSAVNLASRIQGYTLGGEVLVSDATLIDTAGLVQVDLVREVWPKGFDRGADPPGSRHQGSPRADGAHRAWPLHGDGRTDPGCASHCWTASPCPGSTIEVRSSPCPRRVPASAPMRRSPISPSSAWRSSVVRVPRASATRRSWTEEPAPPTA